MGRQRKDVAEAAPAKTAEERKAERRQRFERLAEKRVTKAVRAMDAVARLANRNTYEYTSAEASQIIVALEEMLDTVRDEFASVGRAKAGFSFTAQ